MFQSYPSAATCIVHALILYALSILIVGIEHVLGDNNIEQKKKV